MAALAETLRKVFRVETESLDDSFMRLTQLREAADKTFHQKTAEYDAITNPSPEQSFEVEDAYGAYRSLSLLELKDFTPGKSIILFDRVKIPMSVTNGYDHFLNEAKQNREEFDPLLGEVHNHS